MIGSRRPQGDEMTAKTKKRQRMAAACPHCASILAVIDHVEARCMAADGPVTATLREMTEAEMRQIFLAAAEGNPAEAKRRCLI